MHFCSDNSPPLQCGVLSPFSQSLDTYNQEKIIFVGNFLRGGEGVFIWAPGRVGCPVKAPRSGAVHQGGERLAAIFDGPENIWAAVRVTVHCQAVRVVGGHNDQSLLQEIQEQSLKWKWNLQVDQIQSSCDRFVQFKGLLKSSPCLVLVVPVVDPALWRQQTVIFWSGQFDTSSMKTTKPFSLLASILMAALVISSRLGSSTSNCSPLYASWVGQYCENMCKGEKFTCAGENRPRTRSRGFSVTLSKSPLDVMKAWLRFCNT